jgi:hypothetical protein
VQCSLGPPVPLATSKQGAPGGWADGLPLPQPLWGGVDWRGMGGCSPARRCGPDSAARPARRTAQRRLRPLAPCGRPPAIQLRRWSWRGCAGCATLGALLHRLPRRRRRQQCLRRRAGQTRGVWGAGRWCALGGVGGARQLALRRATQAERCSGGHTRLRAPPPPPPAAQCRSARTLPIKRLGRALNPAISAAAGAPHPVAKSAMKARSTPGPAPGCCMRGWCDPVTAARPARRTAALTTGAAQAARAACCDPAAPVVVARLRRVRNAGRAPAQAAASAPAPAVPAAQGDVETRGLGRGEAAGNQSARHLALEASDAGGAVQRRPYSHARPAAAVACPLDAVALGRGMGGQ